MTQRVSASALVRRATHLMDRLIPAAVVGNASGFK